MYKFKTTWTKVPDPMGLGEECVPDIKSVDGVAIIDAQIVWGEINGTPDESVLTIDCTSEVADTLRADNRFTEVS